MSRAYRPSNGSEGMDFEETYCRRCTSYTTETCPILEAAWDYSIDEPGYPKEWQETGGGHFARCTAFEPRTPELAEAYRKWCAEHPLHAEEPSSE